MFERILILLTLVCSTYSVRAQIITTIAGTGTTDTTSFGGPATATAIKFPHSLTIDTMGQIYICNSGSGWTALTVKKIELSGTLTLFAGNGLYGDSGDGGPATSASFKSTGSILSDKHGNIYIGDYDANRIRKIDASGIITGFAGNGTAGFSGDGGPATMAQLNRPGGLCMDAQGCIYFCDQLNNRIRKIDTNGIITTFVGNGIAGFSGDGGAATTASIDNAGNLMTFDQAGNFYFADISNYRIRKVDTSGTISTWCGAGSPDFSGDGGPASTAAISISNGLCIDDHQNLYILDRLPNHRIRKVDSTGIITTFAGTGFNIYNGDNIPATSANIDAPMDMCYHKGSLYFCDYQAHRIRKISIPPTGITSEPGFEAITINPNPNNGNFILQLPGNESWHVMVTDVTGLPTKTLTAKGNTEMKLEAPPGVYFVRVEGAAGTKTLKMLIQ